MKNAFQLLQMAGSSSRGGSAEKQRIALSNSHCEAFSAHLEMRHITNVPINK